LSVSFLYKTFYNPVHGQPRIPVNHMDYSP